MTRIYEGYAQPDIVAKKNDEHIFIFVETPESLGENRKALLESWQWIRQHFPQAEINIKVTQ